MKKTLPIIVSKYFCVYRTPRISRKYPLSSANSLAIGVPASSGNTEMMAAADVEEANNVVTVVFC